MLFFKKIIIAVFIAAISGIAPPAFAAQSTSANFIIEDAVIGGVGGVSTSTSLELNSSSGDVAPGAATSTSFGSESGSPYFLRYSPRSQNWRWYDDEINETPVNPLANENTAPADIANQNIIKLRTTIKADHIGGENIKLALQFSEYSNFSQDVYNVAEINACAASSTWCYADGGGVDNEKISQAVLSDADSCIFGFGRGCGTHNESGISASTFIHKNNAAPEFEFTIKQVGARPNAVYFFRAFDVQNQKPVPLLPGKTYPSLSAAGASLGFTVSGLGSGIATEGVVTNATTTPTGVNFGTLPLDAKISAAQRITVNTNAAGGYRIFVLERQGLVGPGEINPVSAVNENPANWGTACAPSATGCYGYHTGADILSGASPARFAANDTYAKLELVPKEIVYSPAPVSGQATDIVYSVRVNNQQEAGNYESSIIYIIVPTF
ncbi:MAG: hypothetical protein V1661_01565 [bacterium]